MSKTIEQITDLIGEQISAVAFVCDYVEFHFNGPIIRSEAKPCIKVFGTEFAFPENGSRDALCRVIGSTVHSINLEENHFCELTTSNGCKIIIPLDTKALPGGESMHFVPKIGGPIQVW